MSDLRDELDKLAKKIAANAALSDTSLQESIDALKVLTPYYAMTQKLAPKGDDEEADGATFESFSAAIAVNQEERINGQPPVRSRRRDS